MRRLVRHLAMASLSAGLVWAANVSAVECQPGDFLAGTTTAGACLSTDAKNRDFESVIESWLGGDWQLWGKFEKDGHSEGNDISVTTNGDGSFSWQFGVNDGADFDDAVFVVKQGNARGSKNDGVSAVAYQFLQLEQTGGSFRTDHSFSVSDYSHVAVFTRDNPASVPEIDASQAGIAFGLLAALFGLVRERRRRAV